MPDQVQNTLSWVEIETSRAAQIETMRPESWEGGRS